MTQTKTRPRPVTEHSQDKTWVNLHIGVHFAAGLHLPDSMDANEALLKRAGVHVPSQRQARATIHGMLEQLDGLPPILPEEEIVRTKLLGGSPAHKLMLADDRWAAPLRDAFSGNTLYAGIGDRVGPVAELFASSRLQISLSLLNPAMFLQHSLSSEPAEPHVRKFIERISPETLRWRDTVEELRAAVPGVPLLIWCEEDAPLIWPRVLCRMFDMPEDSPVGGGLTPLRPLLQKEGYLRLETYLRKHPPETQRQYEQVILLFLDKYGISERLVPHCNVPGCHAGAVETVGAHYEEDIAYLAAQDGITFLLPEHHIE